MDYLDMRDYLERADDERACDTFIRNANRFTIPDILDAPSPIDGDGPIWKA